MIADFIRVLWTVVDVEILDNGTPYRIRTCDLRLRRPLLYPTELRAPRGEIDVSIYADNGCELYFQHSESQRFFHKIKLDG